MDFNREYDVEFFTPVAKSLFEHLNLGGTDHKAWTRRQFKLMQYRTGNSFYTGQPPYLRADQARLSKTPLQSLRFMVYNNLNDTGFRNKPGMLHSQASVLPYLLFSPYSPLALVAETPNAQDDSALVKHLSDSFPYCEAFEDLLLASQGRDMVDRSKSGLTYDASKSASSAKDYKDAFIGFGWIKHLHDNALLWPSSDDRIRELSEMHTPWKELPKTLQDLADDTSEEPASSSEGSNADQSAEESDQPETEEDMYIRFLSNALEPPAPKRKRERRWEPIKPPHTTARVPRLLEDLENIVDQAARQLDQVAEEVDGKPIPSVSDINRLLKNKKTLQIAENTRELLNKYIESEKIRFPRPPNPDYGTLSLVEKRKKVLTKALDKDKGVPKKITAPAELSQKTETLGDTKETDGPKQLQSAVSTSDDAAQKSVVAMVTTTEHVLLPDGSWHKRVVLRKRFEDGTTKTTESINTNIDSDKHVVEANQKLTKNTTESRKKQDATQKNDTKNDTKKDTQTAKQNDTHKGAAYNNVKETKSWLWA
jgi:hypothetical protein